MSGQKTLRGGVQDLKESVMMFRAAPVLQKMGMVDGIIRDAADLLGGMVERIECLERALSKGCENG